MKHCWLKHQWQLWDQYTHHFVFVALSPQEVAGKQYNKSALRQRRKCLKCGTMQDVRIAEVELEDTKVIEGRE